MSSKSHLLVCAFLFALSLLSAQSFIATDSYLDQITGENSYDDNVLYHQDFQIESPISSGLKLNIDNRMESTDKIYANRYERFKNLLKADLLYKHNNLSSVLSYRNSYYDKTAYRTYLNDYMKRTMQNDFVYWGQWSNHKMELTGSALYRMSGYKKEVMDTLTYLVTGTKNENVGQMNIGAGFRYRLNDNFSLFTDAGQKNESYNQSNFDLSTLGFGATFVSSADFFKSFEWTEYISWTKSDVSINKRHIVSEMRYKHRIGTNLNGFVRYINQMVYDGGEFLLLSNCLRGEVKYSFPNDLHGESYVLVGGKLSPENDAGSFFAESSYHIWQNIYLGYGYEDKQKNELYFSDMSMHKFSGKWYFLSKSNLYVDYIIQQDFMNTSDTKTLRFGTTMSF